MSAIYEGDIVIPILPYGELPLNASDCMCQSLSEVADAIVLPSNPLVTFVYTCQRMQNCSGVHCDISYSGSSVSADALVDPCAETLHLVMSDSTGSSPLFDQVFADSESVPLDLGSSDITGTLDVGITHKRYSMLLKVHWTFLDSQKSNHGLQSIVFGQNLNNLTLTKDCMYYTRMMHCTYRMYVPYVDSKHGIVIFPSTFL